MLSRCYLTRKNSLLLVLLVGGMFLGMKSNSVAKTDLSERWQRIRTAHYDILFLADMACEAQRMANTLEKLYVPVGKTLHVAFKRIPVILKSQITVPNGFATLGPPRRVEFYTFPTQNYNFLHANDWLNLLAIHELRHVAQHEFMLQNYNFLVPDWLLEGDAVGLETALTAGGRGRVPYFNLLYKVNLLERGGFNYYKQMLGLYKYQVPDHYRLGYVMTTYLRRKYGADIISKLLERNGLLEIVNPFTLYNKCRTLTGRSLTQIYQDANNELKTLWINQLKGLKTTPLEFVYNRDGEDYTDYSYPQPANGGIIALKSGIATPAQFVHIDERGHESNVFTPASINVDVKFTVAKNKIMWIGYAPPLYTAQKSYNTVQSYNLQTKKLKTFLHATRYSYVDLSPDATKLAAFETDEGYNHRLVILDAEKGTLLHAFPNPENYYYLTPTWSSDGKYIVAIKHVSNKATITVINPQTGLSEDLLSYTDELIGYPILYGNYVYYNSAYSGIDNIYAISLETKQRYQVTSSKYGAYNPAISADGKWLLYNDFGRDGMDVVRIPLDLRQWTPIEKVEDRSIRYYEPLIIQENNPSILSHIPDSTYQVEEYTCWKNFSNVSPQFTMLPGYYRGTIAGGFVLRDLLEKAEWVLVGGGYQWNSLTMHTGRLFTRFTYKGWYPIITVDGSLLPFFYVRKFFGDVSIYLDKELTIRVKIPCKWIFGEYAYRFSLRASTQARTYLNPNTWWRIQNYTALFSRASAKSHRDLYSPWGQRLVVGYTHTPYGGPATSVYSTRLDLYFPGLFKNHSLGLGLTYQYKFKIPPFILSPSLGSRDPETHLMKQPLGMSIDYAFPIIYPDFEAVPLTFLQRLRANLFYDCIYDLDANPPLHTVGIDFVLDTKWFNLGLRCMYRITAKKDDYVLLIG